jgi:hypothetical protein
MHKKNDPFADNVIIEVDSYANAALIHSPQVCHRDLEPRGVGTEFAAKTEANQAL